MGAEWVAVGLTLLGFLGSLVNALWARNERRAAAESAALASQVQESMAESQKSIAASLAKGAVAFEVVQHGYNTWLLRNKGKAAVTGLEIAWPDWCRSPHELETAPTALEPGEGIVFVALPRRLSEVRESSMRVVCDQAPEGLRVTLPGT